MNEPMTRRSMITAAAAATAGTAAMTVSGAASAAPKRPIKADSELRATRKRLEKQTAKTAMSLTPRMQGMARIACLATLQDRDILTEVTEEILRSNVLAPIDVREVIYQIAPYAGLSIATAAMKAVDAGIADAGMKLPTTTNRVVTDADRFEKGLEVQVGTFGDRILTMHKNTPEGEKQIIVDTLTGWCFGDTYTRKGFDLKDRELITFVTIATLGGCESQLGSHVNGNLKVGNARQDLIDALALIQGYIGCPRTLNAIAVVRKQTAPKS